MGRRNKNRTARRRAERLRARQQSQLAQRQANTHHPALPTNFLPTNSLATRSPILGSLQLDSLARNSLPHHALVLDSVGTTNRRSSSCSRIVTRITSVIARLTANVSSSESRPGSRFSRLPFPFSLQTSRRRVVNRELTAGFDYGTLEPRLVLDASAQSDATPPTIYDLDPNVGAADRARSPQSPKSKRSSRWTATRPIPKTPASCRGASFRWGLNP